MTKNTSLLAAALLTGSAAIFFGDAQAAPPPGACCAMNTSKLDSMMNPVRGSDEKFFASGGGPPAVTFLLGNNSSMQEFVNQLPTASVKGCTDTSITTPIAAYFDIGSADTTRNGTVKVDTDFGDFFFDPTKYYAGSNAKLTSGSYGLETSGGQAFIKTNGDTYEHVCENLDSTSMSAGDKATCKTCLVSPGYYRFSDSTWAYSGKLLNVNPPKFVVGRKVLKEVVDSLDNVRMAIATFGPNSGMYDQPSFLLPTKPGCDKSYPFEEGTLKSEVRNQINNVNFDNGERSIGEALFGMGGYYSSEKTDNTWSEWFEQSPLRSFTSPDHTIPTDYPGSSGWGSNDGTDMWTNGIEEEAGGQQKAVCWKCQESATIVITDGTPDGDNTVPVSRMMQLLIEKGVKLPNGSALTFSAGTSGTCPNGAGPGGINFCDEFGSTKCACDTGVSPSGPDDTNKNFVDDVAFFMSHMDLREDYDGVQMMRTYTIGFGDNSPLLKSVAKAGEGLFFSASNAAELKSSIIAAVEDLKARQNSFASAAVATVQAGSISATTAAILPRLLASSTKPWTGRLWRFEQFNEFTQDYNYNDAGTGLGSDDDKEDIWLIDSAGAIVVEDSNGDFIKRNTTTAATPFWEASARLQSMGHAGRKIWTVLDTHASGGGSGGDGAFTSADTLTEFTVTNWSHLMPYLGIASTAMCPDTTGAKGKLFTKLNLTVATAISRVNANVSGTITFTAASPTQAQLNELCTKAFILWGRGADLGDEDGNSDFTNTRPSVLADIFHSAPVTIEPPADPFLCEFGIINQCTRTLYSQTLGVAATPLENYSSQTNCAGDAVGDRNAYEKYVWDNRTREKLVVVGSNGGFLHAFRNGTATETCTSGNSSVSYNSGTGDEAWAFIPPDLLGRLQDNVEGHAYLVDGDIMVRDVWAESGTANNKKEHGEFHTVVIGSEGRGGTHYFALEPNWSSGTATRQPNFLWLYPQPCSAEAALFGKTLYTLSPKPPPVGPVLIKTSDTTAPDRYGVDAVERWVVALSGGWSPGRERGRGIYVVDAFSGTVNGRADNLWWKMEYDESASGDDLTPRKYLTQSVTAPVALVDYGANDDPKQDGFFDTALFGDVAGQLWLARMQAPGEVDATTKLVKNWFGGRALEMDRDSTAASLGDPSDPSPDSPKSITKRQPFFYLPSSVIEPGTNKLYAVLGSGNRYSLLDRNVGTCRFDNPLACAKSNCSETKIVYKVEQPKIKIDIAETHWKALAFEHAKEGDSSRNVDFCGAASSVNVTAEFGEFKVSSCDLPGSTNDTSPGDVNKRKVTCGLDSTGELYSCTQVSATEKLGDLLNPDNVSDAGQGTDRFMSFWAYGDTRVIDTTTGKKAINYDGARFDDRTDLVDVTNVSCDSAGCDGGAGSGSKGWVMDYNPLGTKTATGAAIIASCALWSTLSPDNGAGATADVCVGAAAPTSRLYQADVLSGQPNCAAGFLDGGTYSRFQQRSVLAPPPEPAATIQISKNGTIRYSAMIVESGQVQATSVDIAGNQDPLQLVYQVPVSRDLHNCRHVMDGGCSVVP